MHKQAKKDIETIIVENSIRESVEEIHNYYMNIIRSLFPQLSEMDQAVEEVAWKSEAMNLDAPGIPDWLKSDIKRGMIWTIQHMQLKMAKDMAGYKERFDTLSDKEKSQMITLYSDGRILHNLFQLIQEQNGVSPTESEIFEIIHMVLDNIKLDEWAINYSKKEHAKFNSGQLPDPEEEKPNCMTGERVYNHALNAIRVFPGEESMIYRIYGDMLEKMNRNELKEMLHEKLFNSKDDKL